METVTYKNIKFQVWDLGGQSSIRPYWRCYYANTKAIIYVVDSADSQRIGISREELVSMMEVGYMPIFCLSLSHRTWPLVGRGAQGCFPLGFRE